MKPTLLSELFDFFFSSNKDHLAVHSRKLLGRNILGEIDACCEPLPDSAAGKGRRIHPPPKPDQNAAFQGGEEEEEKREKSASLFSSLQSSLHSVVGCMTLPLAAFKCRSPKGIDFTMLSALHTRNPPFY